VEPFDGAWVLVIEDDRDQAELCADVCANAGLNAMTVGTGLQGYWKARYLQPAVIILDLVLPDSDGWEICRVTSQMGPCSRQQRAVRRT
jgi:DNA-binding response OmpR family regulator